MSFLSFELAGQPGVPVHIRAEAIIAVQPDLVSPSSERCFIITAERPFLVRHRHGEAMAAIQGFNDAFNTCVKRRHGYCGFCGHLVVGDDDAAAAMLEHMKTCKKHPAHRWYAAADGKEDAQ